MTISGFLAYVKQAWHNRPNTSTPLSAERLAHMEDGVKGNSNAIEKIAAAVVTQILDDPDKIASMAALYAVNKKLGDASNLPGGAADVTSALVQLNSDVEAVETDITSIQADITDKLDKGAVAFDGVGKVAFAQNSTATSIRFYTTEINYLYIEFLTATANIKFGFYDGSTWTDYWIM